MGSILRKINNFDEDDKTEAISYVKQCIDTNTKRKMKFKRQHNGEVKLTSSLIKKKFALKKKMCRKSVDATRVKPPVLKCRACDETKPSKKLLLKHLETHVGTPVSCIKCRRTFNSNLALEWHLRHLCSLRRKPGVETFKCNECPKVSFRIFNHFTDTSSLLAYVQMFLFLN